MRVRTTVFVCLLLTLACTLASAAETVEFKGRTFVRTATGWVQQQDGLSLPVEADRVTVRFAPGIGDLATFRAELLARGGDAELAQLPLVRVNRLGIHDLELMTNQDPLDIAQRLEATGLAE